MTCHFKRHVHTDEHKMYLCDGNLHYAHKRKTTRNKTKTINDHWACNGKKVHKSIWSCQLGSSLQSSFMSYLHWNAFVCWVHSMCILFLMRSTVCALYHVVWFFKKYFKLNFIKNNLPLASISSLFYSIGFR